ncbi:MAG: endopeptidase La [Bdellovibrionales bacterium]|nr:endopeptidase La [Bdellovibrionales bacterium]
MSSKKRSSSPHSSEGTDQPPSDSFFQTPTGEEVSHHLPLLATSDIVPFPAVVMSLLVRSGEGANAVEIAMNSTDEYLTLATFADSDGEGEPSAENINQVGVLGKILRTVSMPDRTLKVLVQGVMRVQISDVKEVKDCLTSTVEPVESPKHIELNAEHEGLLNRIQENLRVLVDNEFFPEEMLVILENVDGPGELTDVIAAHHQLELSEGQPFLNELDPLARLYLVDELLTQSLNRYLLNERLRSQAEERMSSEQREYLLRSQLRMIQQELGDNLDEDYEGLEELRELLENTKLPPKVRKEADTQFSRLERMPSESSEYALLRTYLEWLTDLPWGKRSRERLDLKRANTILSREHYGLDSVKERIIEYLSVRKLRRDPEGPILCFVGPPGVGKTSLGRSIANATNREFVRISIGGVRDEAEIRGHRRTYVGALPGRIIQGLKQAGTKNPVFVLDELDKVGSDFRGDPSSALLEVLDPQQNNEFVDHYLNVPFDLSQVMFIATANTVDTIPSALLDRLEVINISGYTHEEKLHIAERYLVPRQLDRNGLGKFSISFDKSAIAYVVDRYTREAGVRNLEREIGTLCRKIARGYAEGKQRKRKVTTEYVRESLGPTQFDPEANDEESVIGLVRGLAWTTAGGELLPIEASVADGHGHLSLTGRLGEVMQESGKAALFYARANAERLGLDPKFNDKCDIHIHVPDGATPKDGPSAGIALVTALVSALSNRRVAKDVAMTGEITLRGNVRQIGGLKEKALAALRYGISRVIIPYENIKDLEEIPAAQRKKLKFIPVKHVQEVLDIALLDGPATKSFSKTKTKKAQSKRRRPVVTPNETKR